MDSSTDNPRLDYDESFREIVDTYASLGYPHDMLEAWTIPQVDGRALVGFVEDVNPKNVLEVGTYVGMTSMLLAKHTAPDTHIHTVDPSLPLRTEIDSMKGSYHGCDVDIRAQDLGKKAADRLGLSGKITFHRGGFSVGQTFATRNVDPTLAVEVVGPEVCRQHGPFDFVFVDGLHYHDAVLSDLELAAAHLEPGGTIALHDVIGMWGSNVRAAVSAFLTEHPDFVFWHPPLADLYRSVGVLRHIPEGAQREISGTAPEPEFLTDEAKLKHFATVVVNTVKPANAVILGDGCERLRELLVELGVEVDVEPTRRYDLCVCLDTSPATSEDAADELVQRCVFASDTVVFGSTPPGEFGAARPNERPIAAWVRRFLAHGYVFHDTIRPFFEPMTYANIPNRIFGVTTSDLLDLYVVRKEIDSDRDVSHAFLADQLGEKEARCEQLSLQRLFEEIVGRGALEREAELRERLASAETDLASHSQELERVNSELARLQQERPALLANAARTPELEKRVSQLNQQAAKLEHQRHMLELTCHHLQQPWRVRMAGAAGRRFPRLAAFVKRALGKT